MSFESNWQQLPGSKISNAPEKDSLFGFFHGFEIRRERKGKDTEVGGGKAGIGLQDR